MFNINDYVVYKRDVCKIVGTKNNSFNNKEYYILKPIDDESLTIQVLVDNPGSLRKVISKERIDEIIGSIINIPVIDVNDKYIETEYKNLLNDGSHESLIKIIKTTYLRNLERIESGKKIAERDNNYFNLAEKILYNEFSVVLNKSFEETKRHVIDILTK